MKNLFRIALVFSVILASCKPDHLDQDPTYHVSFFVNGVKKIFSGHLVAHKDTIGDFVTLNVVGANTQASQTDYMGLYISNYPGGANFATGEYNYHSPNFAVVSTYMNNGEEYEAGQ